MIQVSQNNILIEYLKEICINSSGTEACANSFQSHVLHLKMAEKRNLTLVYSCSNMFVPC